MKRPHLLATTFGCALAVSFAPLEAGAAPDESPDPRPWSKGTLVPSLGFGASFGPDIHVLSFAAGLSYFVWHGLAVGLNVSDTVYIYRKDFKRAFPGIEKSSPTNEVLLLPTLQYVFLRSFRFSPYVIAGVGPVFYNHHRGTIGQWLVGGGAYIGLGGRVALNVGIDFYANFPDKHWQRAFAWNPPPDPDTGEDLGEQSIRGCALTSSLCSFNLSPHIGLVFMLGGVGKAKARKRREAPEAAPPNPMEEALPQAEPLPEAVPSPEPASQPENAATPDAPTPVEPAVDSPVDVPPVEGVPLPAEPESPTSGRSS
ncbi:MAG: hypothetical protein IAG13_04660 [Deltaproteobacteria bacterium]|nr:hypothetical protein [Nannocystaceae bacterium]